MASSRFRELLENARYTYQEDGMDAFKSRLRVHASALKHRVRSKVRRDSAQPDMIDCCTDVLFINGCAYSVPHPIRYRVDHQVEQLAGAGLSVNRIDAWNLTNDWARTARVFVIFRCPYTDQIGEFIALAKSLNKTVLFDIDDLVIDRKYTDQIAFLDTLSAEDRAGYDAGVDAMQKTMLLCDGVITTTQGLADELKHYLPTVFVNRNVASEEMLYLSQRAVRGRDVLPFLNKDQVEKKELRQWRNACERRAERDWSKVNIGYFSGSITHNEDFEAILPAIVKLMKERPQVVLHIAGELTVPQELEKFKDRIAATPFMAWRRLPQLISTMDINIAPLNDTVFNRAKSENKWLEAALVKVPTVAGNVGAFADQIEDGVTGFLCSTPEKWLTTLKMLVDDERLRKSVGQAAYDACIDNKVTIGTGTRLAEFITSVARPNIAFVVPSLDISGGNLVTFRHAKIMHDRGYDVTLIDGFGDKGWFDVDGTTLPVLNRRVFPHLIDGCPILCHFDKMVATFWQTAQFVERYYYSTKRYYLVQGMEYDFYPPLVLNGVRLQANATYGLDFSFVTISNWCRGWLRDRFNKSARFARNGLDLIKFPTTKRDYNGKIRILVEGDCSVDYKNVDESFRIVDQLDPNQFEVWYLSYKGEPKPYYRVDKFLHSVPHDEIASVYQACHILLKTSLKESFSYPPLEMMATGGVAVVLSNPGNAEYLRDGENCLLFNHGEEQRAADLIRQVVSDETLREKLVNGGLETAATRDWAQLEDEIAALYE